MEEVRNALDPEASDCVRRKLDREIEGIGRTFALSHQPDAL
jgi:hypothetical protein